MLRLIALICTGAVLICRAAPVFWLPAKNIVDTNDVMTAGTLKYAVCAAASTATRTVNGVTFAATKTPPSSGGIVLSAESSVQTSHGTLDPYLHLPTDYKGILNYAWTSSQSKSATIEINGLTPGKTYCVQVWGNNSSDSVVLNKDYCMTFVSSNSPSRTLDFNVGNDIGQVGQHITGYFRADDETQSFSIQASTYSYVFLNAIQVREDVPLNCWSGEDGLVRSKDFDADGLLVFDDIPGTATNTVSFMAAVTNKMLWFKSDSTVYRTVATNKFAGRDVFLSGAAPVVWVGSNTVSNVVISTQSTLQLGESRTNKGQILANTIWTDGTLRWTGSNVVSVGAAGVYVGGGTFCIDGSCSVSVSENQSAFTGLVSIVSGTLKLPKSSAFLNARYDLEKSGSCEVAATAGVFVSKGVSGNGKLRLRYFSSGCGSVTGPMSGSGLRIEFIGLPALTDTFTWRALTATSVSGTFDLTAPDGGWYLSNPDGKSLWLKPNTGTVLRLK